MFAPSPGLTLTEISHYDSEAQHGTGTSSIWANIPARTLTPPSTGSQAKTCPITPPIPFRPRKFIGPACVIDVTAEVEQNPDFLLTIERVEAWESEHGRIPAGAWVLMRTGWSKRTGREEFLGIQADGSHNPGFHPSCSQYLAKERDILGVGVETVGTDAGQAGGFDPPFPSHTFMHGAGRFGITSLINLDQLPPTGAIVIAAPLKIVNGSGSPLRVLAITP